MSDVLVVRMLSGLASLVFVSTGASMVVSILPQALLPGPSPVAVASSTPTFPNASPSASSSEASSRASPSGSPSPDHTIRPTDQPIGPSTVTPAPILSFPPLVTPSPRPTAKPTPQPTLPPGGASVACSNGVDNSGGLGLICAITVVNTIISGSASAVVMVEECHGAAGDPRASCSTTIRVYSRPVIAITACNGSINGGGGTMRCSVRVTNNFVGLNPKASPITVNQCNGSGGGIVVGCHPYPATAPNAAVNQCNRSANGGTLVGLYCMASGTRSSVLPVTINQCNRSANGGGALVVCSSFIANVPAR